MGHGGHHEGQARLLFEKDDGRLDAVTAADFVRRVRGTAFLVTLNACVSARTGATIFSNLAGLLVSQGIPYALGMQFSVSDDDARTFARVLYDELAKGSSVEEAVYQARLTVAASSLFPWAVGVPVLYTSLAAPAPGQATAAGIPRVLENQPPLAVDALPRAEGEFQGRTAELRTLGAALT
ncbi:MAG: CHAT domain-containing protein, partial [Anaerolineae bacterium]